MTFPLLILLTLSAGDAVTVTVLDTRGNAVVGAEVVLASSPDLSHDKITSGTTDDKGRWTGNLPTDGNVFCLQASRVSDKKKILRSATAQVDRKRAVEGIVIKLNEVERSNYQAQKPPRTWAYSNQCCQPCSPTRGYQGGLIRYGYGRVFCQ
jgi:hypothetical protein